MAIQIVNPDAVDLEDKTQGYWMLGFARGNSGVYFAVTCEYPAFTLEDALDTFADWAPDHAPGFVPDEDCIASLVADAVKDGREDPEAYVSDFYIRAGNDSHWIDMPTVADKVDRAGYDKMDREA